MEAVVVPYKQIKTPKRNTNNCRSKSSARPDKNFATGDVHVGLSFYPPAHLLSPLPSSFQNPQIHRQPPILPTPVHRLSLLSRTRAFPLSPPKPARKAIKFRDQSLTPKKSKSPERNKDPKLDLISPATKASDDLLNASTACLGPDPINLEMDPFKRVISPSPSPSSLCFIGKDFGSVSVEELNEFSGSVFTLSPHPNTLPLPKFSIRSKHACNMEAGGIDAGATDNLRRLLRLQ